MCDHVFVYLRNYNWGVENYRWSFRESIVAISWWRRQMETFSALLAFVRGIHLSPADSPHKAQWRSALMFSLIHAWTNGWTNNRDAGDLRRHRAHYDIIVMITSVSWTSCPIRPKCDPIFFKCLGLIELISNLPSYVKISCQKELS